MLNKIYLPIALVLLTGCSQPAAEQHNSNWWSFSSTSNSAKTKTTEHLQQAQPDDASWWSFASSSKPEKTTAAKPGQSPNNLQNARTQAWLDSYEAPLRTALEGSGFTLERRADVLLVSIPVQGSFNPDRPQMLLPAKLGALTRLAKLTAKDAQAPAVLILGHSDSSGKLELNRSLSQQRAQAVAGIFSLSGFKRDRMLLKGVGPDMPRAANDSPAGRALNRRVEVLLAPQDSLLALVQQYTKPATTILAAEQSH
jgi:outer membrane protein OmpA-like peptidoglycan-associated protein